MSAGFQYEPITSAPVPTAEEMARRNLIRLQQEEARKAAIEKRRRELLAEAQRQAEEKIRAESRKRQTEEEDRPRSRPSTFSTVPDDRIEDVRPKTVVIDGAETPIDEAVSKIPEQLDLEERILSSRLLQRALARSRTEELIDGGMSPEQAVKQATKEQAGRQAAFERGREDVRKKTNNPDREFVGFAESVASGVAAPIARMLGYGQAADEAEARTAGTQAELAQYRAENYAYPQIAGAVAGAAQNTAQMGPGIAASMIAGPGVGMAVMAGQYGSQEYSRAAYEGAEAGLAGDELNRYAMIQGGIEASIMPIMSKIPGLGGIEGRVLRQNIARGVASHPSVRAAIKGAGKLAKDTAAEVLEEVVTEGLHGYTTESMLNEDVDYAALMKDTVLQTIIMMGMTEGVTQAGRLASSGRQAPSVPSGSALPEPQAPVLPPEVAAFTQKPSVQNYEAAVKAGLPPIETPNRDGRKKYAQELVQAQQTQLQTQPVSETVVPESAPVAEPVETPSEVVSDSEYDQFLKMYLEGNADGQKADETDGVQGEQKRQEGEQGRPEGLLTAPELQPQETPSGTEGKIAAALPKESEVPSAISEPPTPPVVASGEASPDQLAPSLAGPGFTPPGNGNLPDEVQEAIDSGKVRVGKNVELSQYFPTKPLQEAVVVNGPFPEEKYRSKLDPKKHVSAVQLSDLITDEMQPVVNEDVVKYYQGKDDADPIIVYETKTPGKYLIYEGRHRAVAAKLDGKESIPAYVFNQSLIDTLKNQEKPVSPRRGIVGDMLTSGEVVQTSSGRSTTPFPKIALDTNRKLSMTLRKAEEWLQSNALAEAEARGDEFNAQQFRNEKPGKMPKATKDSMEEYLFGEQPPVQQSVLKPLKTPEKTDSESDQAVPWRRSADEKRDDYNKRLKAEGWTKSPKPAISVMDSPGVIKQQSLEQQKKSPYKKGDRVTVHTGYSTEEMQIGGEVLEDSLPESPSVKVRVDSGKVHYVMAYYTSPETPAATTFADAAKPQKQEPVSQEDMMEQILREELLGESPAQPKKERKPRIPKADTGEPKTPRKTRTEAAKKRTEETAKELDDAVIEFGNAFGATAPMGISPEQMRASARLVRAALNHGVSKFNEFVAFVADRFGADTALRAAEGIELAWKTLKRLPEYSGIDDAGKVSDVINQKPNTETGWDAVPSYFAEQLVSGKDYKSITQARKEAGEIVGQLIKPGTADAKTLDEAIEHGIVQAGRTIVEEGGSPVETFDKLVDLYARQPVLGVRDTTSMEMQAYSTPVPLAFLASHLGNVGKNTKVYEPTAGNGMLLIGTNVRNAFANELDPDRAKVLRDQGFDVTTEDATSKTPPMVQVVLANPPFGKVKDANRKTIEFNIDGFRTTEVDHAIALQSMKGMEPDGYTVLILAAKGHNVKTDLERRKAYSQGKDRPFYDALYQGYDVTSHFTVDGSLYSRQGASFPVDVIVLRPLGTVRADKKRSTPWAISPRIFNSWGDIRNAFFSDMANTGAGTGVRTGEGDNGSSDLSTRNTDDVGRVPRQDENAAPVDEGNIGPAESEPVVSPPVDGKSGRGRGGKKSGGTRAQSGLSQPADGKRSGAANVSDSSSTAAGGENVDAGTGPDGMAGTGTSESREVDPERHQASYEPSSKNKTVETLIPTNLQDATRKALETVEDEYGSIDEFVQDELGYGKDDPYFRDMSAEQVDAIALAIYSHKKGSGMIVGDMTGVGKGRVAAAMMRYADRQGLVPVFVTEKPDLFSDIYRDLGDIGSDTADVPFMALTTNNTSGAAAIDLPNGRQLKSSMETNMAMLNEGLTSLADGNGFRVTLDGKPQKINAVFTMYSQLQTLRGNETQRRELLRRLMPNAYLIMDESHNAGGTKKERVNENAPPDRAAYAREIVQMAPGVMYLSATFAKRPDVMDLYSKTDMAKAVDGDITRLAGVVKAGGLPLQQVLSAMLGESGQYIRREKSFEGIEFSKVDVGVNLEEQDKITDVFRTIRNLDAVVQEIVASMQDELVAAGEMGIAGDVSTGDSGITSTSFSSILWNAVDQMLFALKADKAADEAIASWKNGEVPIVAVDNTMESILDEYVKDNNLATGDVVNLSFRDVLHRYLERSRWITVDTGQRTERNKKITRKERLTDDQLNFETERGNALELFRQAYAAIEATDIDAPASPIDWIRYRMQKAGMRIAEVTGRSAMLVYNDNGVATLAARPRSEKGTRGKQETIRRINEGSLDGMLLNRSGSTGLSIHASEKVKNQKVRHMMIAQPAKNIDEFMQMLGRVNRTGQVVKPRYSLLMSDSPAELRPAAVLSKKLASLNASVTAKSKGAVGFDVTDVMNEVGGSIVQQYLNDNPEFAIALDMWNEPSDSDTEVEMSEAESLENVVRTATGRSAILPIAQQREFWDDITAAYNAKIEELNALNANPLIAQTMDLDAKTLTSINLFAGKPDEGPFAAPASMDQLDVKNPGKPMTRVQVTDRILEFYSISSMEDRFDAAVKWERETTESLLAEMPAFKELAGARFTNPEAIASRHAKLDEQAQDVISAIQNFPPGTVVTYAGDGLFVMKGVVTGFRRSGKTGNPAAPSRWMIEVAVNDSAKKINVPVSRVRELSERMESMDSVLNEFETMQTRSREKRWMGTGNLVAAYAQLAAQNGKLVFYTDADGDTKRGILMPRSFSASQFLEKRPVSFSDPADMLMFFEQGGGVLTTADGVLVIVMRERGTLMLVAPRARSRGGKYTLNRGITDAAQRDFVTVGNQMTLSSRDRQQQIDMLSAVLNISPVEARLDSDREIARDVLGLTKTGAKIDAPTETEEPPEESELRKAADAAKEAVRAQQILNEQHSRVILKEWQRLMGSGGPMMGMMFPLTDEMARALAQRTLGAIRLGVKQFDAFVKTLRADFDEKVVRDLKPILMRVWNAARDKYDLDEATEAAFELAMDDTAEADTEQLVEAAKGETPEEMPEQAQPEMQPAGDRTYSTQNAFSAAQRQELGMEERPPVATLAREPSVEMAKAEAQTPRGSRRIDTLIQELIVRPRTVSAYENDLLNYRNAEIGEKLDSALRSQIAARKSGDDVAEAVAQREAENYRAEKKTLIELVLEPIGTEAGRALQARKAIINQDFTLERSVLEYEAAYGKPPSGKQLEAMQKQVDDLSAANAELQQMVDEMQAKNDDLQNRLVEAHAAAVAAKDSPPAEVPDSAPAEDSSRQEKARQKINDAYKRLKDLLKPGFGFSELGLLNEVGAIAVDLATGYAELGVVRLSDFLSRVKKRFGPDADKITDQLTAAWKQVTASNADTILDSITGKIDMLDQETIGRAARDLHRFVIERDNLDASAEGREAAVDAVHAILLDFVPDITRDQTARAMSGIGIYSELSKDEIEVIRRDQKAQLLSLEQIADWKKGQAPPATGQERPPVSQEQRDLRRAVNEAKKASGIATTTEGQLRSALDAAKRMAKNRIADLTRAIESGNRIPASRRILQPDAELTELQAARDALQQMYDEAFGKRELSDEQRISRAEKALDRAIADLEADLKAGKLYDDAVPSEPVTSPEIEAKRAQLESLKASREEMRLQSGEAQARSDALYERMLKERDASLAKRIAENDFAPPKKKPERQYTPEMLKLMQSIQKQQRHILEERRRWDFENRHPVYRALMKGPVAAAHILRKVKTTIDQSLIARQGYLLGITHPKIYGKAIRKAFPANPLQAKSIFPTEQDLFNTEAELDADENWVRLEKIGKLAVTGVHGGVNREEGNQYVPAWFDKVWGVGGSERAASAFINTQRRLVFRSLVEKLARRHDKDVSSISNAELRIIGNMVNIATGRGSLGAWANSLEALTLLFFSPRWWMSRLAWWSGQPVWHNSQWFGGEGASWEVRRLAAEEWGKQAAGQALVIAVAFAALKSAFGDPGDDEEWDFYYDPRSPSFGQFRIGRTYIDMTAGLGQHLSLLARMQTEKQVNRWETIDVDKAELVKRYGRGKLAPVPSIIVDYLTGMSLSYDQFGSKEWLLNTVAPLAGSDTMETLNAEGIPVGSVLATMMFFGLGVRSHEARVKERDDTANEVRSMKKQGKSAEAIAETLNRHLVSAAGIEAKQNLRTALPEEVAGLEKIIAGESSPELDDAIQKEKGDIALIASLILSSEDRTQKKDSAADRSIETARELLRAIAPTYEEANAIYTDGYKRRHGRVTEVVRNRFVVKKNVSAARRRLKALYQQKE